MILLLFEIKCADFFSYVINLFRLERTLGEHITCSSKGLNKVARGFIRTGIYGLPCQALGVQPATAIPEAINSYAHTFLCA